MKKALLVFCSFCALVFSGCNSIGDKDTLVARVNGEPIFKEDYAFMMRVGNIVPNTEQMRKASSSLFSRKALYTVALQKNPELKEQLAAHNEALENYLLTFVYQRLYTMDRLMYTDDELAFYYDKHRDQFADSLSYMNLRDKVADAKYIESNYDSLKSYAFLHRSLDDSTGEVKITYDIKERFVSDHRQRIVRETGPALLKKYNIQETEIQMPSADAYYENHKNLYMTPGGFVVYHVESADSAKLAKRFKGKKMDLKAFMKIASKFSENKDTKAAKGFVGKVVHGHPLPYGIGFVPNMFVALDTLKDGAISSVIKSESTGRYHVFYRESVVQPEQKPLDRVRKSIEHDLATTANYELDSNYVLVTKNGEPAIREKDVLAVYNDNGMMVRSRRTHDQVVKSLALQLAFAAEAREVGLDHTWEYRALKRQSDVDYIIKMYRMKVLNHIVVPEDSLKALYERMGNPAHPTLTYEQSRSELSDWFEIPENLMKRTYYYAEEDYLPKTYEEAKNQVFETAYLVYRSGRWDKEVVTSWGTAKVDLFADNITLLPQEWSVEFAMKSADSLYTQAKSLEKAYLAWSGIRERYVDIDSVAKKATFELAHVYSDREEYDKAQREYRAFYRTWPDSPDAEKAMFSRGFILNENLHKDAEALKVFEEFKKLYPKSDLTESVDWLVQNIKSNGKLADDLMKKIEAEE
ncbi:peptidyl-prolyl cis-trans isomerase [Fibrobacter succinogenes]|uniref:peptidylprolyl isomerase n=1 Tax=Fibrobacter succinogenes TaxID=833 RepID=A0A380RVX3_FIBSU|nr:peptidyl-prolyl cis-trans isomerase [Fibrobacter succinogenes]PWJ37441.1 parvulin-like peptidyl-prolyl cis-trans isomerase protein [Fibrobacter succinogenes subsp. elongatus]SUQ19688.1 PPIC-type PPIASE domain-containing protein [Fibrobacter succinogenes]